MIAANVGLTLVVGTVLAVVIWTYPPASWTGVQTLGAALLVLGFILWTVARFQLGRSLTVTAQAKRLVTHGLYSKIRNPIYVFGSMVAAGLMLLLGRPIWLLLFLIVIPMQIWRAKKESSVLEAAFGDEYRKYRAMTWF